MTTTAQSQEQTPVLPEEPAYWPPFFRSEAMDSHFSLPRHLAVMLVLAGAIAAFGLWLTAESPSWVWGLFPVFFLVANFIEWTTHRFPMHRPMFPRIMYRNHTLIHHRAFEEHNMPINDVRELSLVMMPWYTLVMIFAAASPIGVVAAVVGGQGLAGVFFVTSASYFVLYEAMHALHHLTEPTLRRIGVWWLPGYQRMRAHHAYHHRLDRMSRVNFNVTFALADRVLGTHEKPGTVPPRPRSP